MTASTMDFTVRDAVPSDVEALVRLFAALGYPSSEPEMRVRLLRVLAEDGHRVLMATDRTGEAIGSVHIGRLMSLDADLSGQILGLVVAEQARRQGVGRALMTAAENWARSRKCTKVILRSNVRRTEAHAFYERIGYTNLKTQYAFRREL